MNPIRFIKYLIYRWKCHRYDWKPYNYADWVWENDYLDYLETASDYYDNEPPWGCDCGFCDERYGTDDDFLYYWADYPGNLLADDIDFYQEEE